MNTTIKVNISAKFKLHYNERAPVDTIAKIDSLRAEDNCRTGIMCRVVNIWSKPKWFDADWFKF